MKKTVLLLLATAVAGGVFTLGPFPLPHRTSSPRTTPPAIPAQTSLRPSPNLPALDVLTSPISENRERPALSSLDSLPVSSAPASTNSSPRSPLDLLAATYVGAATTGDKIPHPSSTSTYTVTDNGTAINVPENMVYVPAGNFVMGEGTSLHTVYLDAYCINKYEVTNAEYLAFINESGYSTLPRHWKGNGNAIPAGNENDPVLWVSWNDAMAYCAWISGQTGWTITLPTEAQWEKAARGPSGNTYPWGSAAGASYSSGTLTSKLNYNGVCACDYLNSSGLTYLTYNNDTDVTTDPTTSSALGSSRQVAIGNVLKISSSGSVSNWNNEQNASMADFIDSDQYDALIAAGGYTLPAGSFPAGISYYGCHDLAGSAYEWVRDWYKIAYYTLADATLNPQGPTLEESDAGTVGAESGAIGTKVVKGGSWYSHLTSSKSAGHNETRAPAGSFHSVGFRVAMIPATASSGTSGSGSATSTTTSGSGSTTSSSTTSTASSSSAASSSGGGAFGGMPTLALMLLLVSHALIRETKTHV